MDKGIIFIGCSYTWGQGLYYYSKMETLRFPPHATFYDSWLTNAHRNYMYAHRFGRLVASHFGTFEIIRSGNGGCDEQSITFLDVALDKKNQHEWNYTTERYDPSEVGYVIFQTSHFLRNHFRVVIEGKDEYVNLTPENYEVAQKLMKEHNFDDVNQLLDFYIKDYFEKIKNKFIELESKGIKCRMLCWYDYYIKYIEQDDYMKDRFIPLLYDGKSFNTIDDLMSYNTNLIIKSDHEFFGDNPPDDAHPSKKCHRIIADSIITKIESESN